MRRLFERKADREAEIYAEAQALLDEGLDRDFVLELYADEAPWLAELLDTSTTLSAAVETEQPSYFFEASLKAKFLAAGAAAAHEREAAMPAAGGSAGTLARARTVFAGVSVVIAALTFGLLTHGFVTANDAVPGDWNYSLKLANERLQYTLASGDRRVDVQLRQTEARVYELQRQAERGKVSAADIERLQREANELAQLARNHELDDKQKARLRDIGETSTAVLGDVRQRQAALEPKVQTTIRTVNDAMAAGGAVEELPPPTATPVTPTAEPTEPATPTPVPPTATPTEPAPTETPTPPPATATPTPTEPPPTETVEPTPTDEVTAEATSTATENP